MSIGFQHNKLGLWSYKYKKEKVLFSVEAFPKRHKEYYRFGRDTKQAVIKYYI